MSKRDDLISLGDMRVHARKAITLLGSKSLEDLSRDWVIQLALTRLIEIIGEAANRISPEGQKRYANLPWSGAIGMRNKLIHGYDTVDIETLYDTISHDLPDLVAALDEILDDQ